MDRRSIKLFFRKYKLPIAFLSGIVIDLPQTIDAIWSLSLYVSSGDKIVNLVWLYWITIPLGLGLLALVILIARKPILSGNDKAKVVGLLNSVNVLDNKLERFYWEAIRFKGDREAEYERKLGNKDFVTLLNKYSSLRASVSVINPQLSEQARTLITILQHFYGYVLKEWRVNELPVYKKAIDDTISTTENIRKSMKQNVQKLIA